ncbi:MAG: hypothetical protein Q7S30_01040 [Candidatus Omnitrophota bacterium]|nr:hypothetical protein [Candidatus Omnitrophota bacterium]
MRNITLILLAALILSGCATIEDRQITDNGAVTGGILGGLLGGGLGTAIGSTMGHAGTGALIGAGVGALGGALVGTQQQANQQAQQRAEERAQNAAQQQQDSDYYAAPTVPSNVHIKKIVTREYDAAGHVISEKEVDQGK